MVISHNPFSQNLSFEDGNQRDTFLKYLSDLAQKKVYVKLPAKVMLLGNHGAGKSTFLDYFQNGVLPANKESTHILKIVSYSYEDAGNSIELPKALFYDLGGQDYYHGLYQAFFSEDSINLLLWRDKTNKNQIRKAEDETNNYTRDYSVEYWLYQLSKPILLIQTYADLELRKGLNNSTMPNLESIEKDYFISLNKEKIENDDELVNDLNSLKIRINKLINNKRNMPVEKNYYYSAFLNFILKYPDEKFIRIKEDILNKGFYGRTALDNETESDLLIFLKEEIQELSKTGLVLYYKNNDKLNNIVWLNPTKTINYIHNAVLTKLLKNEYEGKISEDEFNGLCKNETERESFDKIKELLNEQKVLFFDNFEKRYIIPGYLPLTQEDNLHRNLIYDFNEKPDFTVKFRYYIPFGLINLLICLYGNRGEVQIKNCWRDELIFIFDNNYRVRITFDFSQLTIAVHIHKTDKNSSLLQTKEIKKWIFFNIIDLYNNGDVRYSHIMSAEVSESIRQISEYIDCHRGSKIPENAYLSIDTKFFIQIKDLEKLEKGHNGTINGYDENFITSGVPPQYIKDFMCFTNNKNITGMKKIFISYSKEDKAEMHDFLKHTITLQEQDIIEQPWTDEWIAFGKEWDDEIKRQIEECDIMVCLVSVDFLNTGYIRKIELKNAMKQGKILVPIIIKPCDWENCDFAKYQVALKGKCISLNENQKYTIKENSDVEKAKFWVEIIKEMRTKIFNNSKTV